MLTASYSVLGEGETPAAGPYDVAWQHGLGTATPQLALFQLAAPSPESWRFVPPNEWDARSTLTTLTLTLATTPPLQGRVGALKLIAVRLDAAPSAVVSASPGGIISAAQLANFRARSSAILAATFPTVIAIGNRTDIPAARWSLTRGEKSELTGFLPTSEIAFRIERAALEGVDLHEARTRLIEDGRHFRIMSIRDAKGDPGLVLHCAAA